jgi:hypothetical protein
MTFITDTIAIGNFIDAEDRATREAAGIRSILCLNGLLQGCKPADCGVEALTCFNLTDGSGNDPWLFDRAVKIVGEYALKHPKLLVHCHAGRSRSVMVVASQSTAKFVIKANTEPIGRLQSPPNQCQSLISRPRIPGAESG